MRRFEGKYKWKIENYKSVKGNLDELNNKRIIDSSNCYSCYSIVISSPFFFSFSRFVFLLPPSMPCHAVSYSVCAIPQACRFSSVQCNFELICADCADDMYILREIQFTIRTFSLESKTRV